MTGWCWPNATSKTNEISEFQPLLSTMDLTGVVITADALHTQRAHARHLIERGAGYVLTVENNQPTLHAQLDSLHWQHGPDTQAPTEDTAGSNDAPSSYSPHPMTSYSPSGTSVPDDVVDQLDPTVFGSSRLMARAVWQLVSRAAHAAARRGRNLLGRSTSGRCLRGATRKGDRVGWVTCGPAGHARYTGGLS